jgi:hypothetical protein
MSIGAIFQNEAPFLKEWIEYHKLIGVEHFYLYNNNSTDEYLDVLVPYIQDGVVELTEWPDRDFPACQLRACSDMIKRARENSTWLAIIDSDEFIVLVHGNSISDFLEGYKKYAGVGINWQLFGTSNIADFSEDMLQMEQLVYKFPAKFHCPWWNSNEWFKSIIQPNLVELECTNSHCFKPKKGYKIVDPNKVPILDVWGKNPRVPIDKIRLNHYWFRTLNYFFQVKMTRPWVANNPHFTQSNVQWLLDMGHSEKDTTILRHVPKLKEKMKNVP